MEPWRFLEVLETCQALPILFPQIKLSPQLKIIFGNAVQKTTSALIRFAVLVHQLNQTEIKALVQRYRIPHEYSDLALLTAAWHQVYAKILTLPSQQIFELLKAVDARRRPERFENFINASEVCIPNQRFSSQFLQSCVKQIQSMDIQDLIVQNLKGDELAKRLADRQIKIIETEKQKY